jgi:hypothetical protein
MPKALRKLCLLSVMTLAVVFAVLSTPRTAAANEPCLVWHFQCQEPLFDCCCGSQAFCTGTSSECDSFCNP